MYAFDRQTDGLIDGQTEFSYNELPKGVMTKEVG